MSTAVPTRGSARALLRRAVQLAERATTPLLPADYLDLFDPLRRGADLRGRIVAVQPETADAATLVIRPGADWAGHVPGQYVRIGIDIDGVRLWRAYSLTHGPRADGRISITVKAVPERQGQRPTWSGTPTPGTLVHLEQAAGDFVLPPDGTKLLFVTAGSGITPVIGMLRNLFPVADSGVVRLNRSADYDITVVHVAPSEPDSIFIANLRALDDAGLIRLVARHTDVHGVLRRRRPGRPGARPARAHDLRLRADRPARRPRGAPRASTASRCSPSSSGVATVAAGEGGTVTFGRTGATVEADGATPILTAAEDAGVLMPSGCRMGICYGCVLPMREGAVRDLRTGEITTASRQESGTGGVPIQTCISAAAGACDIDH